MSYRDDQPYEVPFRAVDHEPDDDGDLDGHAYIGGVGTARTEHVWADKDANATWELEIRDRERRRALLGGFGFRSAA